MTGVGRRLLAGLVGEVATSMARGLLDQQTPGGQARWTRTNHRGEPVSMLEGPAVAAGLLSGLLVGAPHARGRLALTVATSSAAAFGIVDDLAEDLNARRKGLRGHLGALAHGELTTGGLKVLGIGVGALVAAAVATPASKGTGRLGRLVDIGSSGALIALSANLVNLLDVRPGRALKAVTLVAGPLALAPGAGGGAGAAILGVSHSALDEDLAETDMLGDGGANALGAALGTALVIGAPRPVRLAALAVAAALTAASEKVSFTRVIESTPVLRDIDAWGRRPLHVPAPPT
jgi:UDP-N-acetylmuramyl pentapeptide phosphotransferase/UDP-N-acetylglucosamine-1-phosphate transferase